MFFLRLPPVLFFGFAACSIGWVLYASDTLELDSIGVLVLINYALWLLSGLTTGGIALSDLLSPAFYQADGRGFLFYLPLLFFSVYLVHRRTLDVVHWTLRLAAVGSVLLFLVWLVRRPAVLSVGLAANFGGLLTSHTGAGTFFGVLATFLVVSGLERHDRRDVVLGGIVILPMFASGSRESLVALVGAMAWYGWHWASRRTRRVQLGVLILAFLVLPIASPHTFRRTARLFTGRTIALVRDAAFHVTWEPAPGQQLGGVESNILSRFVLWDYAARRFIESPLVGIGFGRFNDFSLRLSGPKGLVSLALHGDRQTNVFNAHNMYLHQLAETGIVGLILLVSIWITIYRRLVRVVSATPRGHEVSTFYMAAACLVVFTLISACFDNALVAPSIGIPVLTIVGVGISFDRRCRTRALSPTRSPENEIVADSPTHTRQAPGDQ